MFMTAAKGDHGGRADSRFGRARAFFPQSQGASQRSFQPQVTRCSRGFADSIWSLERWTPHWQLCEGTQWVGHQRMGLEVLLGSGESTRPGVGSWALPDSL